MRTETEFHSLWNRLRREQINADVVAQERRDEVNAVERLQRDVADLARDFEAEARRGRIVGGMAQPFPHRARRS